MSGYERATFGSRPRLEGLGLGGLRSPRHSAHARRVTSPRALSRSSQTMKRSSSDHNLHNVSDNSALVNFSHLNGNSMENGEYPSVPAVTVSMMDHGKAPLLNGGGQFDRFEGLLKQASLELTHETEPVLLSSQVGDVTPASTGRAKSEQLSPPERQAASVSPSTSDSGKDVSGNFEDLHSQLDKKKAALSGSRGTADEVPTLDPEKW